METIFRGCTRPALVAGVPLVALVSMICPIALVTVWLSFLAGVYAWIWSFALVIPIFTALRQITLIDDQRLLQCLRLLRLAAERRSFRALASRHYSPLSL
jgi:type IV secretory pathway VirB3-like protein